MCVFCLCVTVSGGTAAPSVTAMSAGTGDAFPPPYPMQPPAMQPPPPNEPRLPARVAPPPPYMAATNGVSLRARCSRCRAAVDCCTCWLDGCVRACVRQSLDMVSILPFTLYPTVLVPNTQDTVGLVSFRR